MNSLLSVRPVQKEDITLIVDYWNNASEKHLLEMGINLNDLSVLDDLQQRLEKQLDAPLHEKAAYVLVAEKDKLPIGHCYVNNVQYGIAAYMHLHIWSSGIRQKGWGSQMVRQAIPYFFNDLQLQTLFCEPYAGNPAPNRTLNKIGFNFEKRYTTIPAGWNFELEVQRWYLTKKDFEEKFKV